MTTIANIKTLPKHLILAAAFLTSIANTAYGQSPKKYYENGMYEQAFVEAVYKQNKKVKLKEKFTDIIYKSYEKIYKNHSDAIHMKETDWQGAYNATIRMVKFRAKVRHEGVRPNLKNVLYDEKILDQLGEKFNADNKKDMSDAQRYEREKKFDKALEIYDRIAKRHEQADPITTLTDRLALIDHEHFIKGAKQRQGDQYIAEAARMLDGTEKGSQKAIVLINQAKSLRPLSPDEENLLEMAKMMKGDAWIQQAEKLLQAPTKQNARLAYELIQKAAKMKDLTQAEAELSEKAKDLGTTRVMVKIQGKDHIHDTEFLCGHLNKSKPSKWIQYYFSNNGNERMDFEMAVSESMPSVVVGKMDRKVETHTKDVEYEEEETDQNGNTTMVKKTRKAVAVVAHLSKTKTALMNWSVVVTDVVNSSAVHSASKESQVEHTNEYASLVSGDALGMPEDTETKVDLDSQPFPTNREMEDQVIALYLSQFKKLILDQQLHTLNLNAVIKE